jgi:hypothetical protein
MPKKECGEEAVEVANIRRALQRNENGKCARDPRTIPLREDTGHRGIWES